MLNQEDFINRLHKIFNHYGLTAATFSDEIKVPRSSISHLLSGRNKPSLEFVLKIVDTYKEVSMEWLLYGKESFPKAKHVDTSVSTKPKSDLFSDVEKSKSEELVEEKSSLEKKKKKTTLSEIERIVIFYKNGSFKEYLDKD